MSPIYPFPFLYRHWLLTTTYHYRHPSTHAHSKYDSEGSDDNGVLKKRGGGVADGERERENVDAIDNCLVHVGEYVRGVAIAGPTDLVGNYES